MKNRLFALVLALVMMFSVAAVAEINAEGMPITTEPITLTAMVNQTEVQGDFNEIVILKEFEEVSGIDIQ